MEFVVAGKVEEEEGQGKEAVIEGVEEDEVSSAMQEEACVVGIQQEGREVIGRGEDTVGDAPSEGAPGRIG